WQLGYRDGAIFKWLLRHRRPMRPKRLEFQSGGYRQRRYFWLRLDRFDTLEKLARVRAEIAKGKLTIRSANLRELTIDWQRAPSRVMAIRIDGQLLSLAPSPTRGPLPSSTTLHRGAARRWQLGPSPRAGLQKRPGLSGPIPDARYDPQLFVYGTQRDDETAINRMRAETDARFHSIRADVRMPVKRDRDVTAEDIARYHLVLYGTPAGNALLGTILAKTPLRVDAKGIRVGGARFEGRHLGVALIYPNPLNPQRYVVVLSGTSWRGVLATRYLPRWLPDYVVFDENGIHRQLGGKVMDKRRVRGGGFFDARWRFDPKRLWRPH
ncbi:MAG: hypothetical protein KC609_14615, partial [Myxococcales bacterium]|nr:hypothetical protein [Myxococcales bacterium]